MGKTRWWVKKRLQHYTERRYVRTLPHRVALSLVLSPQRLRRRCTSCIGWALQAAICMRHQIHGKEPKQPTVRTRLIGTREIASESSRFEDHRIAGSPALHIVRCTPRKPHWLHTHSQAPLFYHERLTAQHGDIIGSRTRDECNLAPRY